MPVSFNCFNNTAQAKTSATGFDLPTPTELGQLVLCVGNRGIPIKLPEHRSQAFKPSAFVPESSINPAPPVFSKGHCFETDLIVDQASFNKICVSAQDHLRTGTLSEQVVLELLKGGFFQSRVGKWLAPLFVDAMMRSVRPKGDMTVNFLREIVEVICFLPPDRWGDAFGERLNFPAGTHNDTVVGFIQAQLTFSRFQRDEKIANGELLADAQWQSLCEIVEACRSSVRPWREEPLNSALIRLEEVLQVRPSPEATNLLLGQFLECLDEPRPERFPERHKRAIEEFKKSIQPEPAPSLYAEWTDPALITAGVQGFVDSTNAALYRLGALSAHDVGNALFSGASSAIRHVSHAVSMVNFMFRAGEELKFTLDGGTSENTTEETNEGAFPLLNALDEIERKGEFFDFVVTSGPSSPQGLAGKLVYALNAVNAVGSPSTWINPYALFAVTRPETQSPTQPEIPNESVNPLSVAPQMPVSVVVAPVVNARLREPMGMPSGAIPREPLGQAHAMPPPASLYENLEKLARDIDALFATFTRSATGYVPVEAADMADPRSLLAALKETINTFDIRTPWRDTQSSSFGSVGNPYTHTVEPIESGTLDKLRDNLAEWLSATARYLAVIGMTTLNAATGIVQQHPRASVTLAMAGVYAVVLDFYNQWFLPGNEEFFQETDPGLRNQIINAVETFLSGMPEVLEVISARIANSTYEDPHQDPQLVPDISHFLEQRAPWNQNITSGEVIVEAIEHAESDYARHNNLVTLHNNDESNTYPTGETVRTQRQRRAAEWTIEALAMRHLEGASAADKTLIYNLAGMLHTNQHHPIVIPEGTLIHSPVKLYQQAVNQKAILDFFDSKGMDLSTLRIFHDSVTGAITENGETITYRFTLWDNSGWWQVAKPLLPMLKLLDPDGVGLRHLGVGATALRYEEILSFYGVSQPSSSAAAQVLASQLEASGFPEFSSGKKARLDKAIEEVKQANEEAEERAQLIMALELGVKDKPDNASVSLSDTLIDFVCEPLAQASQEIRHRLNDFLALPLMVDTCEAQKVDCSACPVRVTERKIQIFIEDKWVDLTGAVNTQPVLKAELEKLFEQTQTSGNALYSSSSSDLLQLVRFKGFDAPANAGEVRNIMRWLTMALPPSPPLGNYATDSLKGDATFFTLSNTEKAKIIELSKELMDGSPSFIEALGVEQFNNTSLDYRRANADSLIRELINTDESESWGQQLIAKLNWYGAAEGQTGSSLHYQYLLLTAIKLSIDPDMPGQYGTIAGYDIYQPKNMGRELGEIRTDIEDHLIKNKGVNALSAPLVAHLFLAEMAPEFLAHNVSKGIHMGTAKWMTLRLGVAIAEAMKNGCSRGMTNEQLMELAVLDPVTEESRLLFQSLSVDIIVAWGIMNGVVQQRMSSTYTPGDYEHAAKLFAKQRAELGKAFEVFSCPLRTRRELAMIEIRKVFPSESEEEIEGMKLWTYRLNPEENLRASKTDINSLINVYMSHGVDTDVWWLPRAGLSTNQFKQKMAMLPDINDILNESVDDYFKKTRDSFVTTTKLTFAQLPLEDRQCLALGKVELFTLREETGRPQENETAEIRAASRGQHGTLMRCEHGDAVSYFEVFPAQMRIIKRSDLPRILPLNGVIKREDSRGLKGTSKVDVQRGTNLPFDFLAYSTGSEARAGVESPKLIIEKLGRDFSETPLAGHRDESNFVPNIYYSDKISNIIKELVDNNFLQGRREHFFNAAKESTQLEETDKFFQNITNYLLQLIPFVGCVQDLLSGTNMGLVKGGIGCFGDVVSALFGLGGVAGKAVGMIRSFAPAPVKAFNVLKITVKAGVSVVNPISGLPDLVAGAYGGLKRVTHRVFEVTQSGITRLQCGIDQLRAFLGGPASEAANNMVVKWTRPRNPIFNGIFNGTDGTAIHAGKWYAFDKYGGPLGPVLENFLPHNPPV
ncbi:TPA: hypothetical protein SAN82_005714 [Pseudomonas putida]|nr:hypothetical protein [Pseudomonas putida]